MLNEDEKKAIEILERIKNMKFNITSSFYSSGTISLSIEEKEAIETVLNELEKKDKEIEQLEIKIDNLAEEQNEREKYTHKLEKELNEENNRCMILANNDKFKEQIIEEMAEELVEAHEWFYSEFDNFTKEDFIEYFTKKVEDK